MPPRHRAKKDTQQVLPNGALQTMFSVEANQVEDFSEAIAQCETPARQVRPVPIGTEMPGTNRPSTSVGRRQCLAPPLEERVCGVGQASRLPMQPQVQFSSVVETVPPPVQTDPLSRPLPNPPATPARRTPQVP
ncbi:hypothetical protein SCLCIDRAFT_29704 [Scleroderma citrinum Foug A]|uniref:Uncharacterized protein n=1 Tax=Scleroderma citrinum Foug A TaxID=1036808 RepID=A0A0C2ZV53_9AGAM|nr:hypothetical protein SCLCIDRAFT_29704 [Scleroderma citrinum Foug A]